MKLLFLILIIPFAGLCQFSDSRPPTTQAVTKFIYRFTYQTDSLNPATIVTENALLFVEAGRSRFVVAKRLLVDSAMKTMTTRMRTNPGGGISMAGIPKTRFNYRIYKNYSLGIATVSDQIGIAVYKYEENRAALNWTIAPEKQAVAGYNCQKATVAYGGRRYVAWFTPEIPVPDGPFKFWGLPGLIVRISDVQNYFIFELTALQQLAAAPAEAGFLAEQKFQLTTRQAFRRAGQAYQQDPFAGLGQEGIAVTEDDRMRYRERMKRRNNPLELK